MSITQQNPTSAQVPIQSRSGFTPIPTRIRDTRQARGVPPLVVDPIDDARKESVVQALGELATRLAEIHRTAAEAYLSQGLYEQAIPHLEAAVTFAGTEIEYRHQLGFVRYIAGDDAGAIECFQSVLASQPGNAEASFNLGMVLFGQSRFDEAEQCFRSAIENGGNDAQTWNNRGVCLWQLKRISDARACFEQALRIDPQDEDARFNLASI
ncbi:MAG: hypothetical protein Fur0037_01310 [Planctomycetota bacterium]